jgi:hypothetical protein
MQPKESKKRAGPTVYCCGTIQSVTQCVSGTHGVTVRTTDSVLVLGSGLGPVVKSLGDASKLVWLKEDGSR